MNIWTCSGSCRIRAFDSEKCAASGRGDGGFFTGLQILHVSTNKVTAEGCAASDIIPLSENGTALHFSSQKFHHKSPAPVT